MAVRRQERVSLILSGMALARARGRHHRRSSRRAHALAAGAARSSTTRPGRRCDRAQGYYDRRQDLIYTNENVTVRRLGALCQLSCPRISPPSSTATFVGHGDAKPPRDSSPPRASSSCLILARGVRPP